MARGYHLHTVAYNELGIFSWQGPINRTQLPFLGKLPLPNHMTHLSVQMLTGRLWH